MKLPTLDELTELEKQATKAPIDDGECVVIEVPSLSHLYAARTPPTPERRMAQADAALYRALRNAAPHLLAIAEADHEWRELLWETPDPKTGEYSSDYARRYDAVCAKAEAAHNAARAAGLFGEGRRG